MCWYDDDDERVKTQILDTDCTDKDTSQICEGIIHSLKNYFPGVTEIKLHGQCTDRGGGGTKHALKKALKT